MADQLLGDVMIVGGTGMLAQATEHVAPLSNRLTLGTRQPGELAKKLKAIPLHLNWKERDKTLSSLSAHPKVDLLISWLHDDGVWLAEYLEEKLVSGGRSIRVHGALSRDPKVMARRNPNPRSDVRRQTVILGWVFDIDGQRWLTNDEISQAVVEAVERPELKMIVAGTVEGEDKF
jgi:hypothetical protein